MYDFYFEPNDKRIIDKEIQKLIASKVKNQFGNSDDLDNQIEKKNGQATNVIFFNKK